MFLGNYSPGTLGFCLLFAFMPLVAALDVAHTSTYCDHLREMAGQDRNRLDAMTPEVPF